MPNEPPQLRLLVEILQTCHFGKKFEHLRFTYQESDNETFKHTRQISSNAATIIGMNHVRYLSLINPF